MSDWQRFAAGRFRWYHLLALAQGIVGVMTGFDVLIPFVLAIGCPPAVTPVLGMLPLVGGMSPLVLPALLARVDGNLRWLTIAISAVNETRGLLMALLVVLLANGVLAAPVVLVLIIVITGISGVLGSMVGTNLLTWHSAVLSESDRRLVVPRLMSISLAVGALLLLPTALVMDALVHQFGIVIYAVPFALAGTFGLIELVVQWKLPRPGRVRVPPTAMSSDAVRSPAYSQFLQSSFVNAIGMGIAPYISVYAIAVLGLTPGFTMAVAAIGMLTQVVTSAVAGARLTRGSSSQMLRFSFAIRAGAMAAPLLALPGFALAPVLLILSAMLGAIGFVSGTLAANERLFRLINGPAVLRQYGRFTASTAGAMTIGQLVSGGALAVGATFGYPVYAVLYAASTGLRIAATRMAAPLTAAAASPAPAPIPESAAAALSEAG